MDWLWPWWCCRRVYVPVCLLRVCACVMWIFASGRWGGVACVWCNINMCVCVCVFTRSFFVSSVGPAVAEGLAGFWRRLPPPARPSLHFSLERLSYPKSAANHHCGPRLAGRRLEADRGGCGVERQLGGKNIANGRSLSRWPPGHHHRSTPFDPPASHTLP
jgi:hypothetical protein